MILRNLTFVMLACLFSLTVNARGAGGRDYRPHEGYLESVEGERDEKSRELVIALEPPQPTGKSLQERIFTDRLSKEFREKAEERFGRTEALMMYNAPDAFRTEELSTGRRETEEETLAKQRAFGTYMARRLVEYHLDNYAKNEPRIRPAYELKERISTVKLQVAEGYRINAKYSISGNFVDINLTNPYIQSKVILQMGGGGVRETIVSLKKDVTPTVSLGSYFELTARSMTFVGSKALTSRLSTSLTGSSRVITEADHSVRDRLFLAGLSYTY